MLYNESIFNTDNEQRNILLVKKTWILIADLTLKHKLSISCLWCYVIFRELDVLTLPFHSMTKNVSLAISCSLPSQRKHSDSGFATTVRSNLQFSPARGITNQWNVAVIHLKHFWNYAFKQFNIYVLSNLNISIISKLYVYTFSHVYVYK